MMDEYLPVGSVVLLKGGEKRILIIGRAQREDSSGRTWDYLACPFPEGFLGVDNAYLFDHAQIDRVFFLGLQDEEEMAFQRRLTDVRPRPNEGRQ